jgi:hypothetical protein
VAAQHIGRATPRFIFLTDRSQRSVQRDAGSAPDLRLGGRVAWRMLAANNRPMGRSAMAFEGLDECFEAAMTLHRNVDCTTFAAVFRPESSRWGWSLLLDGERVAVSAHHYHRRIECLRGLRQFMGSLATAVPQIGEVRHIGPRSLGVYDQDGGRPLGAAGNPISLGIVRPIAGLHRAVL